MFMVIVGLLTHGSLDWPTGQLFIVSYDSLWVRYPSVMITNLTLVFAIRGGASPPLSTAPICNYVYFCSLTITTLVSELCSSIFYWWEWYGGSDLLVYAVPASRDTWEFYCSRGAPLTSVLVGHPTGKLGAVQNHAPSPLLCTPPIPGKVVEAIQAGHYVDFKDLLPDNVALRQRVVDTGILGLSNQNLCLHEVGDVGMWLHCFLAFVAAKVESPETRELVVFY